MSTRGGWRRGRLEQEEEGVGAAGGGGGGGLPWNVTVLFPANSSKEKEKKKTHFVPIPKFNTPL